MCDSGFRTDQAGARAARVRVDITNQNEVMTRITFGACALSLRLYDDPDRSRFVGEWRPPGACQGYLVVVDVEAGSSLTAPEFSASFPLETLEDVGISRDRYHLSVALRHNWRTHEFPVGVIEAR